MKRTSRVTADVTKEAHDLLRASCLKFDCSKGKLLERMIRNFCAKTPEHEIPGRGVVVETSIEKPKTKNFKPPTPLEVDSYFVEKGINDPNEAQSFCDFYESNGWKVGKNKMKSWKASVRNWLKGYKKSNSNVKSVEHENLLNDNSWANNLDQVL